MGDPLSRLQSDQSDFHAGEESQIGRAVHARGRDVNGLEPSLQTEARKGTFTAEGRGFAHRSCVHRPRFGAGSLLALRPSVESATEETSDKHDGESYQQHPKRQLDRTPDAEGEDDENEQEEPDHELNIPGIPRDLNTRISRKDDAG
jgi:hypothetical protein